MIEFLVLLTGGIFGGLIAALLIHFYTMPKWFKKWGGFMFGMIFGFIFTEGWRFL